MLATTNGNGIRLTIHDLWQTKEEELPVSLPTGTASAVFKLNDEWVGIDIGQAWFWTDEWQAGEREVDVHIAAGEYEEFDSLEEMFKSIHDRES